MLTSGIAFGFAIVIAILCVFPIAYLIIQYRYTKLTDSLIFAGAYFFGGISNITFIFGYETNQLIYYQFMFFTFNTIWMLFFLHAVRIKWSIRSKDEDRVPRVIWYTGWVWYLALTIMILFWEKFPQPRSINFLGFKIPRVETFNFPNGGGYRYNDQIIYSTDYDFLAILFSMYALLLIFYSYYTIDVPKPTKRIMLGRKLWLIAFAIAFIFNIISLPILTQRNVLGRAIIIFALIIVLFILVKIPETMLISRIQLLRGFELYKTIIRDEKKGISSQLLGMDELKKYIIEINEQMKLWTYEELEIDKVV